MSLLQCVSPIHMVLMICTHMYISHLYLCLSHIYVCIYVSALHMVLMILRLYSTPSRTQGAGRRSHQGIGHGARGFKAAKPAAVNGALRAVWVNMGHRIEAEIRRHLQQARPPEPYTTNPERTPTPELHLKHRIEAEIRRHCSGSPA